jgi:cysteine desulfurase
MMIYLDNNATTKVAPEVAEAMIPFLSENFGNPSSAYSFARLSKRAIAEAREMTAELLGAEAPDEIVFTSGGTESDNWAIRGVLEARPDARHIVTTAVEHEAVRNLCDLLDRRGYEVTRLGVDKMGAIDLEELRESLREDTAIVSMMLANNETGVIFPVEKAAEIVRSDSRALFHVDAVNAAGKVKIDASSTPFDLISVSAHKFHGPKGVGALYIRRGLELPSSSIGGGQESGRRAGTEAVHQIAGMGKAAELVSNLGPMAKIRDLRDRLENSILGSIPKVSINGDRERRLPNTSNLSFPGVNGEVLLAALNDIGVCVSTGSACNEGDHRISPVLKAMEVPFENAAGSIRFSLGRYNTSAEIDFLLEALPEIVSRLRSVSGYSV